MLTGSTTDSHHPGFTYSACQADIVPDYRRHNLGKLHAGRRVMAASMLLLSSSFTFPALLTYILFIFAFVPHSWRAASGTASWEVEGQALPHLRNVSGGGDHGELHLQRLFPFLGIGGDRFLAISYQLELYTTMLLSSNCRGPPMLPGGRVVENSLSAFSF